MDRSRVDSWEWEARIPVQMQDGFEYDGVVTRGVGLIPTSCLPRVCEYLILSV